MSDAETCKEGLANEGISIQLTASALHAGEGVAWVGQWSSQLLVLDFLTSAFTSFLPYLLCLHRLLQ